MNQDQPHQALPLIEPEARPLLNYMGLSHLPGNYIATVRAYFEVLRKTENWQRLAGLVRALPQNEIPPPVLDEIGQTALWMHRAHALEALQVVHRTLLEIKNLTPAHLGEMLALGDAWRKLGQYQLAFDLYRIVGRENSDHQKIAHLWAAYCGFYLEDLALLESMLVDLPVIQINEPHFSLRELINALWEIRQSDYPAAMRAAALGKTHAVATDPWYPQLLHTLALLYEKMEMPEAATLAHQEVSIIFPASQWAAKSLEIIHHQTNKAP